MAKRNTIPLPYKDFKKQFDGRPILGGVRANITAAICEALAQEKYSKVKRAFLHYIYRGKAMHSSVTVRCPQDGKIYFGLLYEDVYSKIPMRVPEKIIIGMDNNHFKPLEIVRPTK